MTHVKALAFKSDSNLGLYGFATDSYCLVGHVGETQILESILQVPVFELHVLGTQLVGVFLAGTDKFVFAPSILFDSEKAKLVSICDKIGAEVIFLNTKFTAIGNVLFAYKDTIFLNSEVEEHIEEELSKRFTVHRITIADTDVVGSSTLLTSRGGIIHPHVKDDVADFIEKETSVRLTLSTVNYGSAYVRSGVIANKNGFVIGKLSSGPEITNADEAFGFLEQDEN
jgi:translation initiation factor 6